MKANPDTLRERESELQAALQSVAPPAGLRETILQSMEEAAKSPGAKEARRLGNGVRKAFAIAALLAVAASGAFIARQYYAVRQFQQQPHFRDAMAYYISAVLFRLDFYTDDLERAQQWLDEADAPLPPELPPALAKRIPYGCKKIQWSGITVSLICFYKGEPEEPVIHLFIADRDTLSEAAFAGIEQTLNSHGLETRGWKTSDKVCVLVPGSPGMSIERYVELAVAEW